jgi:hypothetical protein
LYDCKWALSFEEDDSKYIVVFGMGLRGAWVAVHIGEGIFRRLYNHMGGGAN